MSTFWRNKKVLITGHTGFKGSWLSLWLQALGANVIGFALPPDTEPNLFTLAKVADGMTSIYGDIRDYAQISQVIQQHRPQIIIHMAAQPLVRYSYSHPIETYATNVMGTLHLLEAIRQEKYPATIVNVTTDKCYENKEWHWGYRENDPMGGYDPYSSSKGCAELLTAAYRNSYQLSLASARAGNVIGGGDWAADRLIPDIINACMKNQTVTIRSPHAIRPWQHVLEPLSGYLTLAEKLFTHPANHAEAWNFGPEDRDAKPVAWITQKIIELWGSNNNWHLDQATNPHEATYLKLDCSKAKAKLHWLPQWSLEQALVATVSWYKAFQQNEDMREVTLSQIQSYADTAKIGMINTTAGEIEHE